MILSVSRRTDIPAFYTEWFFKRLKEGYALVRNPMNYRQVSKIALTPEVIDCIVFWTKDPLPILKKIDLLTKYNYYFHVTITPYDQRIEPGVPAKAAVIETFKQLSSKIGREKMIWRYDPIILTAEFDTSYHCRQFEHIAGELYGYTTRCIISFLDIYKKTVRNMSKVPLSQLDKHAMLALGRRLYDIASKYELKVEACSELIDLSPVGIGPAKCIDGRLIASILGQELRVVKDKNQREVCGCVTSVDIGAYNTCKHGCLYCYANFSDKAVKNNLLKHDPNSPLLVGHIEPDDKITERKLESYRVKQLNIF